MNRIIIAGNGFDLAHDLKTKYEDFINWYWENTLKKLQECFKLVFNEQNRFYKFISKLFKKSKKEGVEEC